MPRASQKTGDRCAYRLRLTCRRGEAATTHGQGCKCMWEVHYEMTEDGWVLYDVGKSLRALIEGGEHKNQQYLANVLESGHSLTLNGHNHNLFVNEIDLRSSAGHHYVPNEPHFNLDFVARSMATAGQPIRNINRTLTKAWRLEYGNDSIPPWNYQYLQWKYKISYDGELDWTGFQQMLEERRDNTGLERFLDCDFGSRAMARCFIELDGAREEWARGGEDNVLLIDPTFATNVLRMPFCMLVSVAPTGETVILAYALIDRQSHVDFQWLFECFHEVFRMPPSVVFSDHDPQIESAMLAMTYSLWPNVKHFLCIYHLSKNFHQHLRKLFLGKNTSDKWRKVHNQFWRISKETDARYCDMFEKEWAELVKLVEELATNREHLENELKWLQELGKLCHRFAYCFTFVFCTLGIHATVRIEAMQNVAKNTIGLSTTTGLVDLHKACESYNKIARMLRAVKDLRKDLHLCHVATTLPEFLSELQSKLTTWPFQLLLVQHSESVHYKWEKIPKNTKGLPLPPSDTDPRIVTEHYRSWRSAYKRDPKFHKSRYMSENQSACLPDVDRDQVVNYEDPADYGVPVQENTHKDRLLYIRLLKQGSALTLVDAKCSCQFARSWGFGSLCRHVITMCQARQVDIIDTRDFTKRWLCIDAQELARAVVEMRTLPSVQSFNLPLGQDAPCSSTGTVKERRDVLRPLLKWFEEFGETADDNFDRVVSELKCVQRLLLNHSQTTETSSSTRKKSARLTTAANSAAASSVTSGPQPNAQIFYADDHGNSWPAIPRPRNTKSKTSPEAAVTAVNSAKSTTAPAPQTIPAPSVVCAEEMQEFPHYSCLEKNPRTSVDKALSGHYAIEGLKMHEDYEEVLAPQGRMATKLLGQHILYRWPHELHQKKYQNDGWFVGQVKSLCTRRDIEDHSDPHGFNHPNFYVDFGDTGGPAHVLLLEDRLLNINPKPKPPPGHWFLLQRKTLHQLYVKAPYPPKAKKGRPTSTARKRTADPTVPTG